MSAVSGEGIGRSRTSSQYSQGDDPTTGVPTSSTSRPRRGSVTSSIGTQQYALDRSSSLGPASPDRSSSSFLPTRARAGSRAVVRASDSTIRKAKFAAFASEPSIAVEAELMTDIVATLPDMSEVRFARQAANGSVVTISVRHLCLRMQSPSSSHVDRLLTVLIEDIATLYDNNIDDCCVFVRTKDNIKNWSQKDYEVRMIMFESRTDREHFIAHIHTIGQAFRSRGAAATESGVQLISLPGRLSSVQDIKAFFALEKQQGKKTDDKKKQAVMSVAEALAPTTQDYLDIAHEKPTLAAKLIAEGSNVVLYSSEAQTADNKHDIVILTNIALYIGKVRNENLKTTVPIPAIEGVTLDSEADDVLLLQLNFSEVKLRGDLLLRFPKARLRDTFLKALTRQYEETVVGQLPTTTVEDVFWAKRGFVESQLVRLVNVFEARRNDEDDDEALTPAERQSAQWLLWTFQHQCHVLVGSLAPCPMPDENERQFLARSLLSLAKQLNMVEVLLRFCVQFEMFGQCGHISGLDEVEEDAFRHPNLTNCVIDEFFVSASEMFVEMMLGQMVEEFSVDPRTADDDLRTGADLAVWVDALLRQLFASGRQADVMPDELKVVVALIGDVWTEHERAYRYRLRNAADQSSVSPTPRATPNPEDTTTAGAGGAQGGSSSKPLPKLEPSKLIGRLLSTKLFCPALRDPNGAGLVGTTLNEQQMDNINRIASCVSIICTFEGVIPARQQVDDAAEYCVGQQIKMLDYLKDIVFSGYVNEHPSVAPSQKHSFSEMNRVVKNVEVDRAHGKLLCAVNRVMAIAAGRLVNSAWTAGAMSASSIMASSSSAGRDRAMSSGDGGGGDSATKRSKLLLDDDDIAPPGGADRRRGTKKFVQAHESTQEDAATIADLQSKIAMLQEENTALRVTATKALQQKSQAESERAFYHDQAGHFRTELMRERGISDSDVSDSELLEIERQLRRKRRSDAKKILESESSDEDQEPQSPLSPNAPPNPLLGSDTSVNSSTGNNRGGMPSGKKLAPSTAQQYVSGVYQGGSSTFPSSGDGFSVSPQQCRPWGCPLESYTLAPSNAAVATTGGGMSTIAVGRGIIKKGSSRAPQSKVDDDL